MLEALYQETCLPKCSVNSLDMNFECLNVSVAQKLTELQFFLYHQLLTAVINIWIAENQCWRHFIKKLVYQKVLEISWT